MRVWTLGIPEIVHLTVSTPYPGTETWLTEIRKLAAVDYRLFDIQHAVLPTRLPLRKFHEELVAAQLVFAHKHLGAAALRRAAGLMVRLLLAGQTNFLRSIRKFNRVYNAERQHGDHLREVRYAIRRLEVTGRVKPGAAELYVHAKPRGHRQDRALAASG